MCATEVDENSDMLESASLVNLASVLRERFRASDGTDRAVGEEATTLYNAATKSVKRVFGEGHIRLAKTLREKALMQELMGDNWLDAEESLRQALAIRSRWSTVTAAADDGNGVGSAEAVVADAAERIDMIVALARACQAQGKTAEVAELDEPLMGCLGVLEAHSQPASGSGATNADATAVFVQALRHVRDYKQLSGQSTTSVDQMLGMFKQAIAGLDGVADGAGVSQSGATAGEGKYWRALNGKSKATTGVKADAQGRRKR
jgi:hypothetical protein